MDPGMREERREVLVVGGGPSGSTAATLVAHGGRDVLLVDRETFPRFRIGESLMPATWWTFERLGFIERLKASAFPRKHSVQFFTNDGRSSRPFYFSEVDPGESAVTWQVDRATFDRMLLDHARAAGVEVRERTNVRDVLFEGPRVVGVEVEEPAGTRRRILARVVIDASGQSGLLSRRLKLREVDPVLRHAAIFTRYRGARRDPGIDGGATLVLRTADDRSWFWFIPLHEGLDSVGVVGPVEHLNRAGGPAAVYEEELRGCPALAERLGAAERVAPYQSLRDFSYISRRIGGDGWVMAGDAFGFLDPLYSSGVFLALTSGELAADAVLEAFRRDDFSAALLGAHGERYLAGMEAMRKLVYAYYDPHFSIGAFARRHPELRGPIVDLLTGNVYRREVDGLFDVMSRDIDLPAARSLDPVADPSTRTGRG
jgi:flavin-dependent dehydrogenase